MRPRPQLNLKMRFLPKDDQDREELEEAALLEVSLILVLSNAREPSTSSSPQAPDQRFAHCSL